MRAQILTRRSLAPLYVTFGIGALVLLLCAICAAPANGAIGARRRARTPVAMFEPGPGGGVRSVWLAEFTGAWTPRGIEVRWRFAGAEPRDARLQHATEGAGPWSGVSGAPQICDGESRLLDRDARHGEVNHYRLLVRAATGRLAIVGTLSVAPVYALRVPGAGVPPDRDVPMSPGAAWADAVR